jgi:hypothetical protein
MRLGTKGKKALSYAKKGLVVAGAVGSIVGIGHKVTHGGVEKVVETKNKVEAAPVIAGAVVDVGKDAASRVKANPLKAPQVIQDAKVKVGGIKAAAKIDPVGAADTIQFARNPTAPPPPKAPVDSRYGTADEGGTGRRRETQDTTRAGDIEGMINTCKFKYKKRKDPNDRRKCIKRVKAGGRP